MGCKSSKVNPNLGTASIKDQNSTTIRTQGSELQYFEVVLKQDNIFSSIKKGDSKDVREMIISKPQLIFSLGMWSSTSLIVACQYSQPNIAAILIETVEKYLSGEIDINDDQSGSAEVVAPSLLPPLREVFNESKRKSKVKDFLNHRSEKGACALLYACMGDEAMDGVAERMLQVFDGLLDVNVPPSDEPIYDAQSDRCCICTPLSVCVTAGKAQLTERLLICGSVDVNAPLSFDPMGQFASSASTIQVPLLMLACIYGQVEMLRVLLRKGCNILSVDHEGSCCLHYIAKAKSNNVAMLQEILRMGSNESPSIEESLHPSLLTLRNSHGDTWLHVCCDNKQTAMCEMLLKLKCDVNISNSSNGSRPLHIAVRKRCLPLVKLLLEHGADPTLEDNNSQSAWNLCSKLRPDSDLYLLVQKAVKSREDDLREGDKGIEMEDIEETDSSVAARQPIVVSRDELQKQTQLQTPSPMGEIQSEIPKPGAAGSARRQVDSPFALSSSRGSDIHDNEEDEDNYSYACSSDSDSKSLFAELARLQVAESRLKEPTNQGMRFFQGDDNADNGRAYEGSSEVKNEASSPTPSPRPLLLAIAPAASAAASSAPVYIYPIPPPQQPVATAAGGTGAMGGGRSIKMSRIQAAASNTLAHPNGTGKANFGFQNDKSDSISIGTAVDKIGSGSTVRSSAYIYSTPEKEKKSATASMSPIVITVDVSPQHEPLIGGKIR